MRCFVNTTLRFGPTPGAGCLQRPSTTSFPRRSLSSGAGLTTCPRPHCRGCSPSRATPLEPSGEGSTRRERLWLKAQSGHVEDCDAGEPESADGRVLAALAVLRERDREALTLVAWDGLTPAQAADTLGVPPARFRQRLHRAGRRLRAELADVRAAELRRDELAALRHDHAPTGGPA